MFAAINPAHALSAFVGPVVRIEREIDLIPSSLFRGLRRLSWRLSCEGRREASCERDNEQRFPTKHTKPRRTQRDYPARFCSFFVCLVVRSISHSQLPGGEYLHAQSYLLRPF